MKILVSLDIVEGLYILDKMQFEREREQVKGQNTNRVVIIPFLY
jgi:hypothetical protein